MIQDQIVNFRVPNLKYVPKRICSEMIQDQIVDFRVPTLNKYQKEFTPNGPRLGPN